MLKDLIKNATVKELREARDYIDSLLSSMLPSWYADMDEKVLRSAVWVEARNGVFKKSKAKDNQWYCRASDWFKYNLPEPYKSLALSYEINNLFLPTSMSFAVEWLFNTKEWKEFWKEVGRCYDQWLPLPEIPKQWCVDTDPPETVEVSECDVSISEEDKYVEPKHKETTNKELLEKLPDWYRERALKNMTVLRYVGSWEISEAIMNSIDWSGSPEWTFFWTAVYHHYTYWKPLPPLPEE